MATPGGSGGSPGSPSSITDIAQLQRWAQHADVTMTEFNKQLARLNNLLTQVIALNSLKTP
jgi:hypothetical protein